MWGVMLLRLVVTGLFSYYVAEVTRYLLVPAGAFLLVMGGWFVWDGARTRRRRPAGAADPDSSRHAHEHRAPVIAYALLLPLLALMVVAPAPLGSYSAARDSNTVLPPSAETMAALEAEAPVGRAMPIQEFVVNAIWYNGRRIADRPVELTGFVTPDPAGGWWIARLSIACCAGDAKAAKVKVLDAPELAADTWVTVTGTWMPGGTTNDASAIPTIRAESVTQIPIPADPYERPFR